MTEAWEKSNIILKTGNQVLEMKDWSQIWSKMAVKPKGR